MTSGGSGKPLVFVDKMTWHDVETLKLGSSEEEFEDTKGVIRSRKSKKDRQHTIKRKRTNGLTTSYKTYI